MKTAYLECSSGVSGDMILGALVDAGVSLSGIEHGLKRLPVRGYALSARKVRRAGLSATKVDVDIAARGRTQTRRWQDIRALVAASRLDPEIRKKGLAVFRSLFEAEARSHATAFSRTHLHELGAVDCLVDVFGSLIGISLLGVEEIASSSVNVGSGSIRTSHGLLPVPTPATVELLKGIPVYAAGSHGDLTTPTGAAILRSIASSFGLMPMMRIEGVGVGAGSMDLEDRPNVARLFVGVAQTATTSGDLTVLETNIDDMNPQIYDYLVDRLFQTGALDVFLTQGIMKKNRPAVKVTILCADRDRPALTDILFQETTTLGCRFYPVLRTTMDRAVRQSETGFGCVRLKDASFGATRKTSPEYDDCRRIAEKTGLPLREVMAQARRSPKTQGRVKAGAAKRRSGR